MFGDSDFELENIKMFEIAPSILAADFTKLGTEIGAIEKGGATLLHFDVMDGQFVPNITIGLPVLKSVRKATKLAIDCHLMIENPSRYAVEFVEAGADLVSVHIEADVHLHRTLTAIREAGAKAGVAINPATALANLEDALPFADYVVLMSVNPGFGGQKFIATALDKLKRLREMIEAQNLNVRIEIDGGVDAKNIKKIVESGAEIVVAGSAVFGGGNPQQSVRDLIEAGTNWI